jgi:hypothetical protein
MLYSVKPFSQKSSPACTELEMMMMDWLGKLLDLPGDFLFSESGGKGGGVIQVKSGHFSGLYIAAYPLSMYIPCTSG